MTTSLSPDLVSLREKQQKVWSSGDYNRIAALTVPVNEATVVAASVIPGDRVLDVATGTGHSALAAARQGGEVTAIDYVPALLDIARGRAAAEHLDIDFVEAPAEVLPFGNAAFDTGISSIGIMFAADHEQAARIDPSRPPRRKDRGHELDRRRFRRWNARRGRPPRDTAAGRASRHPVGR